MTRCYLALGSNLNSPVRQLRQAIKALRRLPHSTIVHVSKLYFSRPMGLRAQAPYWNLVLALNTSLNPFRLLSYCQKIELDQNRIKKHHWGSRTIDIDILLYGHIIINQLNLTVPHPHMLERDFVLLPLLDISPEICMPNGQRVSAHLKNCRNQLVIQSKI